MNDDRPFVIARVGWGDEGDLTVVLASSPRKAIQAYATMRTSAGKPWPVVLGGDYFVYDLTANETRWQLTPPNQAWGLKQV